MNFFSNLKYVLKLFPAMLVSMFGVVHCTSEISGLIGHYTISIFRFRFDPTLWTFFLTLFVTIVALVITVKIIFKNGTIL